MHYSLIIKNGILVTSKECFNADIAVSGGKIVLIGEINKNDTSDEVYNAAGLHILSGIIDAHVHFREPGLTEKEDFESGSTAAAFGGITTIADMPNVLPVTSTVRCFNEKIQIAKEKSYVDFSLFALLNNDNLNEVEGLINAGALGFKVFLGTSTGDIAAPSYNILMEQMRLCASLGIRTGFHAENDEINKYFTYISKKNFPVFTDELPISGTEILSMARPENSEVKAIEEALLYAKSTGAKIHIHHVTTADGCELISEARKNRIDVTAETCPHYLLLDIGGSVHKVYPPIRSAENRKALWKAIRNGKIDFLASDHAPHTAAEKSLPLWEAPAGLTGVETFVPLILTDVNRGNLSINDFVRLASVAPAKTWGIYPQKGCLLSGADADFTVVDMEKKRKIEAAKLHSKSKTSAYDNWEVQGIPVATIVRGRFVMREGELTGNKGFGEFVKPYSLTRISTDLTD